jgi:hypothetical protein
MTNTYRLVVCVDVQAEDPAKAYGETYEGMTLSGLDWESSDEWFGADGNPADPEELQTARMEYLDGKGLDVHAQVCVLTYTHKHGVDVSAYRTREGAVAAAYGLACARVEEDRWEDNEARAKFEAFEDFEAALGYFHEVELEWNYSENLEITESRLGD